MTLKRTALPPRTSEPKRYSAPKKQNAARIRKRKAAAFGAKADFIRLLACVVHRDCAGPVEAHHVKTRGAGGGSAWLAPLCQHHHSVWHTLGRASFAEAYSVDLEAEARHLEVLWRSMEEQP